MGVDAEDWPEMYAIAPGKPVQEGPVSVTRLLGQPLDAAVGGLHDRDARGQHPQSRRLQARPDRRLGPCVQRGAVPTRGRAFRRPPAARFHWRGPRYHARDRGGRARDALRPHGAEPGQALHHSRHGGLRGKSRLRRESDGGRRTVPVGCGLVARAIAVRAEGNGPHARRCDRRGSRRAHSQRRQGRAGSGRPETVAVRRRHGGRQRQAQCRADPRHRGPLPRTAYGPEDRHRRVLRALHPGAGGGRRPGSCST